MAIVADLVLEDGTGVVTANTYALVPTFRTYHNLFGNESHLEASDDQVATGLVNGTQYVDLRWVFVGTPTTPSTPTLAGQALCWPQTLGGAGILDAKGTIWDDDEAPTWVIDATLEYALEWLTTGRLLPTPPTPDPSGRFITLTREKLGPLEEENRYSDTRGMTTTRRYAQADKILRASGLVLLSGDRACRA